MNLFSAWMQLPRAAPFRRTDFECAWDEMREEQKILVTILSLEGTSACWTHLFISNEIWLPPSNTPPAWRTVPGRKAWPEEPTYSQCHYSQKQYE